MHSTPLLFLFFLFCIRKCATRILAECCVAHPLFFLSVIAAAAKYYNDSKNHDPCAVVVKDVAQAVVIHYVSLRELLSDF